jgi:hypothetical protein
MKFVHGNLVNALVPMALDQGRSMMIIVEGGEYGKVHFYSLIKEGIISSIWEMHGQLVKDISSMDNQVCCIPRIINVIGNKVLHGILKIWI